MKAMASKFIEWKTLTMNIKKSFAAPPRIAVVIPCYNEALSISIVIDEVKSVLPEAEVHVFDNCSTDHTIKIATSCGANVTRVALKGKGYVVRRMFADVEADIYLLVDGDATYDLSDARSFISRLQRDKMDMIVGSRIDDKQDNLTYRLGHRFGNRMLTRTVATLFGGSFTDMLSGYRVFSRRFAKSFPTAAKGFEIETELTVHALELCMPYVEMPVKYRSRPTGSESKLDTYRDGFNILWTITKLFMTERPFIFFLTVAAILSITSFVLTIPLALTYIETGLVPRLPTAILATGLIILSALSVVCGAVLNTVTIGRQEAKRLRYLSIPATYHLGEA
jgi:glycosyltransferase involved in cell wall biosynthesis